MIFPATLPLQAWVGCDFALELTVKSGNAAVDISTWTGLTLEIGAPGASTTIHATVPSGSGATGVAILNGPAGQIGIKVAASVIDALPKSDTPDEAATDYEYVLRFSYSNGVKSALVAGNFTLNRGFRSGRTGAQATQVTVVTAPGSSVTITASGMRGTDGAGVPAGGTTGQILAKASGTNYATTWVDAPVPGSGSGNVVGPASAVANNAIALFDGTTGLLLKAGAVLAAVATSGAYADLTGKPTLFSGAYADLTGKPTLFSGAYADLSGKPTLAAVATSGAYADLTGVPTLFSGAYADLTGKPALFSGAYADLTGKPSLAAVATSGAYADLTGKPTTLSSFTNDSAFIDTNGTARSIILKAGTTIGTRRAINFIEGTGITLSVADNSGAERVDVTINASSGGGTTYRRHGFARAAAGSATISVVGLGTGAVTGTATARTPSTTNLFTSEARVGYVSAGTVGASSGWRYGVSGAGVVRGNADGIGGFEFSAIGGTAAFTSDGRLFIGLYMGSGVIGSVDPSTLTNIVGLGLDSADSNLQIMHNDGAGTCTKVDLGANFPGKTANTDLYFVTFTCSPNASEITWSVKRLNTGDTATGTITTELPANTTYMQPHLWINNGATASACAIDVNCFDLKSLLL